MTNKSVCEHYLDGQTKKDYFLGNEVLSCKYAKNNECPYGNSEKLAWEGEEPLTVCLSKGLIKRLEEVNTK